jgi:hypothetical protein
LFFKQDFNRPDQISYYCTGTANGAGTVSPALQKYGAIVVCRYRTSPVFGKNISRINEKNYI